MKQKFYLRNKIFMHSGGKKAVTEDLHI